ncbi:hypothetical protein GIB67_040686 [Kingdonia uniflora]|uniref:Uncharacterized protein n=1 Tax=Kingdonia uniflora TaxID=39325 RepID=A0A7J7KUB5_9MAGN|nr:hypothetical protein GIB67_040686 [Kingdonia uniflora]
MESYKKTNLPLVFLFRNFPFLPSFKETFSNKFHSFTTLESPQAQSVKAIICSPIRPLTSQTLQSLPSLELVLTTSVGIDHIDIAECRRRGISVTNAGTVFTEDVADYGVGLLIDVLRRVSVGDRYMRGGNWATMGEAPLGSKDSDLPIHEFLKTHAQSVRVLLCLGPAPLDCEALMCLPSLECIVGSSAGVNHIDLVECKRRGIAVTNAGSVFSEDVADYAVGMLIDVLRRVSAADRYVRSGLWSLKGEYPLGHKVWGKRVGIIGLGSIGSQVAKRLEAFGCIISYNSRNKKLSVCYPYFANVHELAANSDVLIATCALTEKTYHIINKDVLLALGKEGVVINVGRGALIDEKELVRSLVQGEIGGAGLDVFENEPNVPKELFELDNVVLSPHKAVLTLESFSDLHELIIANLDAFFSNKPLLTPVKLE